MDEDTSDVQRWLAWTITLISSMVKLPAPRSPGKTLVSRQDFYKIPLVTCTVIWVLPCRGKPSRKRLERTRREHRPRSWTIDSIHANCIQKAKILLGGSHFLRRIKVFTANNAKAPGR